MSVLLDAPTILGTGLGLLACYWMLQRGRERDAKHSVLAAENPEPDFVPSTLSSTQQPLMVGSVQRDILNQLVLIGKMSNKHNACLALQSMAGQYTGRLTQPDFATAVNSYLENVPALDPDARSIQAALTVMRSSACAPTLVLSPLRSALSFPAAATITPSSASSS